jgi:gas vesicle protein
MNMGNFLNGLLVGVGVGLLVAPRKGEEMRRVVGERTGRLWDRVSNTSSSLLGQKSSGSRISNVEEYYTPEPTKQPSPAGRQTTESPPSWIPSTQSNVADTIKQTGQRMSETGKQQAPGQGTSEIRRSPSGNERRNT